MDYLLDFVVGSPQTPRFPATLIQEARGGRRKMQTEWRSERRLIDHMSGMYTPSRLYANSNVQGGFPSGAKNTRTLTDHAGERKMRHRTHKEKRREDYRSC